jgi:hypothetical protein
VNGNELEFVAVAPRRESSLFYLQKLTDSPALEPQPVPTLATAMEAVEGIVDEASADEPPLALPRIALSDEARQAPPVDEPFGVLYVSVGAAALTILVCVLVLRRHTQRRR